MSEVAPGDVTSSAVPAPGARIFTAADLALYDGIRDERIYIGFQGRVYDMSARHDLYGQGAGYAVIAGRDGTRSLGKMSLKAEDAGRCDVADLMASELAELHEKALRDWAKRFEETYVQVGTLAAADYSPDVKVSAQAPSSDLPRSLAPALPALRPNGVPQLICRKPRLFQLRGFLTPAECRILRRMSTPQGSGMMFEQSKIRDGLRVEDEKWSPEQRELLTAVEARLGWLLGSEPHADEIELVGTLTPATRDPSGRCHLGLHVDTNGDREWRYATAICYLSPVPAGGRTVFPCARPAEAQGPPEDEEMELVAAAERLLEAGVDHTDRVIVLGQSPELRPEAETLVAAAEAGAGVAVAPEEGSVVLFWTRGVDGSIDPHSWHGGEAVGEGASKWTLQKFKEIPVAARANAQELAAFVASTRRNIGP